MFGTLAPTPHLVLAGATASNSCMFQSSLAPYSTTSQHFLALLNHVQSILAPASRGASLSTARTSGRGLILPDAARHPAEEVVPGTNASMRHSGAKRKPALLLPGVGRASMWPRSVDRGEPSGSVRTWLARHFHPQAVEVIEQFRDSADVEIIETSHDRFEQGLALYKQYADKQWGFIPITAYEVSEP